MDTVSFPALLFMLWTKARMYVVMDSYPFMEFSATPQPRTFVSRLYILC
jgi:hypothetical protein